MSRVFTPQEKEKLIEFRSKVKDVLKTEEHEDDYFLIRWLRARNLDIIKAEEMLRKSLQWRIDNKVDGIIDREAEDVPMKFKKIYPTAYFGQDKENNPIIYLPLGRFKHRIAIEQVGLPTFYRYNIVWMETIVKILRDQEKATGLKGLRLVELIDMEGYSLSELYYAPAREFVVETQKTFEANYPEICGSVIIINAPKIFAMLFAIVKPLLPKETLEKINIFGSNEDTWKQLVREKFNLEKIPVRWGGTLEGSDIFCTKESVWIDGPIPLEYFTGEKIDEDGLKTVKVGARDKLKLHFEILIAGSELKWRFKTENHDIGFEVSYLTTGENLVPWARVDSHNCVNEGSLKCQLIGKYLITFDNNFSYTKSKLLSYSVEIIEPFTDNYKNGQVIINN